MVNTQRRSQLEKIYFWMIEGGIYLALFTPFIFSKDFFFPYVVPKTIFFRIIIDVILIPYVLLAISNARYRPKINIFSAAVLIFVAVSVLSAFLGVNPARSFWSTFERMTGILTLLHLAAFFVILTSVFFERKYWERILTVSIIVGIFIAFYSWSFKDPTARGAGTIGNTSFMAAYLLFDIFFALILFFIKGAYWKIFYGASAVLLLAAIFISPEVSRGGSGAFFGGIFLLGFLYFVFYALWSKKKLLQKLIPAIVILIILTAVGILQLPSVKQKLAEIKSSTSWDARAVVWQMALRGWQERPWLGWGTENFNVPFAKYFDPKLPRSGDLWYDRVHNIFLDTAVDSGAVGFLSYLSIFGVAVFMLFRVSLKVSEKKNAFLPLGMIAILAVYLAQDIWVFDMISSYLVFFLSLAFINFLISQKDEELVSQITEGKNLSKYSFSGAILIVLSIISFYFGNIQPARASKYILNGIASPLDQSIVFYQKAIAVSPITIIEGAEQFSRKMGELSLNGNQNQESLIRGFELATQSMQEAITKNPRDFRLYLLLGRHYNDFYRVTLDVKKLDLAEEFLAKAKELSPNNQQVYWTIAQNRLSYSKPEESIEMMKRAAELDPTFGLAKWYVVLTYKVLGDYSSSAMWIEEAVKTNWIWQDKLDVVGQMIEVYQQLQDDERLNVLYPIAIKLSPQNAQLWAGLAVAKANLKNYPEARAAAQKALELKPDFSPQLEEFLKSLPQ